MKRAVPWIGLAAVLAMLTNVTIVAENLESNDVLSLCVTVSFDAVAPVPVCCTLVNDEPAVVRTCC